MLACPTWFPLATRPHPLRPVLSQRGVNADLVAEEARRPAADHGIGRSVAARTNCPAWTRGPRPPLSRTDGMSASPAPEAADARPTWPNRPGSATRHAPAGPSPTSPPSRGTSRSTTCNGNRVASRRSPPLARPDVRAGPDSPQQGTERGRICVTHLRRDLLDALRRRTQKMDSALGSQTLHERKRAHAERSLGPSLEGTPTGADRRRKLPDIQRLAQAGTGLLLEGKHQPIAVT